jgi:hypothetical protein
MFLTCQFYTRERKAMNKKFIPPVELYGRQFFGSKKFFLLYFVTITYFLGSFLLGLLV